MYNIFTRPSWEQPVDNTAKGEAPSKERRTEVKPVSHTLPTFSLSSQPPLLPIRTPNGSVIFSKVENNSEGQFLRWMDLQDLKLGLVTIQLHPANIGNTA